MPCHKYICASPKSIDIDWYQASLYFLIIKSTRTSKAISSYSLHVILSITLFSYFAKLSKIEYETLGATQILLVVQ